MKYPPPAHAAMIWAAQGGVFLSFGEHCIRFAPDDRAAWDFIVKTLTARIESRKIASEGAPTQWQYDHLPIRKHYNSGEALGEIDVEPGETD